MKYAKSCAITLIVALLLCPWGRAGAEGGFIKWVDFNATAEVMNRCYELDVKSVKEKVHYNFVDLLAYLAMKNGNKFSYKRDLKNLNALIEKLDGGITMAEICGGNKYYKYYHEAYSSIFAEYIGFYRIEETGEVGYGLKAYFPLARGFWYSGSDDFGNSRTYGFKRVHLGHDMFGAIGTPVIAVEGGIVTELGWNRFGGWRIGIRSLDGLRYYYYAHLRKDKPYAEGLEKGKRVEGGQVIGYLGVTGYSFKENRNMKTRPHLHFGLQLIFDPSQEDGPGEIWINVYQLVRFLSKNKAAVKKDDNGGYFSCNLKKGINL
ncbi:MAG: M23 family metallopeptidase [Clostridiales bacterium]|nr:M23 family metallopeptidase [Clostridiales bacterium]